MQQHSPFSYFKTSLEIIRLAIMMYVRFPLPLRNVEGLFHELGEDRRLKVEQWSECSNFHVIYATPQRYKTPLPN
jgi:hypothetical protein